MPDLAEFLSLLRYTLRDRRQLVLENIALRHQLAVYERSVILPSIKDGDRIFRLTVMRVLKKWRRAPTPRNQSVPGALPR